MGRKESARKWEFVSPLLFMAHSVTSNWKRNIKEVVSTLSWQSLLSQGCKARYTILPKFIWRSNLLLYWSDWWSSFRLTLINTNRIVFLFFTLGEKSIHLLLFLLLPPHGSSLTRESLFRINHPSRARSTLTRYPRCCLRSQKTLYSDFTSPNDCDAEKSSFIKTKRRLAKPPKRFRGHQFPPV